MFVRLILIFLFVSCSTSFAQKDSTKIENSDLTKHQIGIGISKFVNSAFPSDKNAYSINYRYQLNEKISLRSGVIYEKDDSESGFIDIGLKLGVDKKLKSFEKWYFYYGIDLMSNFTNYKNIDKDQYMLGAISFIGIQFNISKNFSFSVEPGIYLRHNITVDNATFANDKKTSWTESGLGKLGYVNLNFHF
jgi:hypothetical protein